MDSAVIVALIGLGAGLVGAIIKGLWSHISGRRKTKADAHKTDIDASNALINGFMLRLDEVKAERREQADEIVRLNAEIDNLEIENRSCQRRVAVLETQMIRNHLELPPEGKT